MEENFTYPEPEPIFNITTFVEDTLLFRNSTFEENTGKIRIYNVYIIMAFLMLLASTLFFILWNTFEKRCIKAPILLVQTDTVFTGKDNDTIPWKIVLLMALFHFFHMGIEVSYKGLVFAYSAGTLKCSVAEAAWITTLCFVAYTVGRGTVNTVL